MKTRQGVMCYDQAPQNTGGVSEEFEYLEYEQLADNDMAILLFMQDKGPAICDLIDAVEEFTHHWCTDTEFDPHRHLIHELFGALDKLNGQEEK